MIQNVLLNTISSYMIQEAPYEEVLLIRKEVMYPDRDTDYVKLANDNLGLHMGYYDNGELASIVSLFLEGRDLQFRKLATLSQYRDKGYASFIIKWILGYAHEMKLNKVWCNARKEAVGFYEKYGFTVTDKTFSRDGYDYVVMEKTFTN